MGINGLLPFLKKSSRRANVREFSGQTVAIDAYCWLHKGAFSCAEKLVMNEPTVMYITYCMKFVNMLLSHDIKPILVFDGRYLPAKAGTEKKRRETREANRKKGAELLRAGQVEEGRSYLRRAVDITHEMALNLIQACRKRNVDCIVAPYEADAQLAYLNIKNIAQLVITEDSDLLLFGCIKVLFKMDVNGNGILIEKDRLHVSMGVRHDNFTIDKFRYMCILSGCDYLPSLPGIGLGKACKFINRTTETNIYDALSKLPVNLQMWSLVVTEEYRQGFVAADKTFRYQLVYDPVQRKQVPLNETKNEEELIGSKLDEDTAFHLAVGNIDPITLKRVDTYDPDRDAAKNVNKHLVTSHKSIWSCDYAPSCRKPRSFPFAVRAVPTKGLCITAGVSLPTKRSNDGDCRPEPIATKEYLYDIYSKESARGESPGGGERGEGREPEGSPILFEKKNPFALTSKSASAKKSCLGALKRFKLALESDSAVSSRYFNAEEDCADVAGEEDARVEAKGESNLDDSSASIRCKLSKFSLLTELNSSPRDDEKSSSREEGEKGDAESKPSCFDRESCALKSPNGDGERKFYGTDKPEVSPYFTGKGRDSKVCESPLSGRRTNKSKGVVGKDGGKRQSMLTRFGFQPKAKIPAEKT